MDYFDTGVTKQAIGMPTEAERVKLKQDGYCFMSRGVTEPDENGEQEPYEIWIK